MDFDQTAEGVFAPLATLWGLMGFAACPNKVVPNLLVHHSTPP